MKNWKISVPCRLLQRLYRRTKKGWRTTVVKKRRKIEKLDYIKKKKKKGYPMDTKLVNEYVENGINDTNPFREFSFSIDNI